MMWPRKHNYQPKIALRGDKRKDNYAAYVHFENKYLWYHMKKYTPSRNQAWKLLIRNLERAFAEGFVAEPNAHKNYTFNSGNHSTEIEEIKSKGSIYQFISSKQTFGRTHQTAYERE